MLKDPAQSLALYRTKSERLEKKWRELCDRYLPLIVENSIWRYSRGSNRQQPTQGWKLHISATVLSAGKVLQKVAPFLSARSLHFKAPCTLRELSKINSGLYYGYSQVGKVLTIYPSTSEEAVSLAHQLHKLTFGLAGPAVPFDLRFSDDSNVYYRFGAFKHLEVEQGNGRFALAILDFKGDLIPDDRMSEEARPDWISDPFEGRHPCSPSKKAHSPVARSFRVLRALVQRGKGGVYQAIDLSATPPRLCLLKEGRKNGELSWDGRDGVWRVRNEEHAISTLRAKGVDVPRIYSSFELDGNYYLATEFIEGECLHNLLIRLRRRMQISRVLQCGIQLSRIFLQIHAAGWVWRDCKPVNILVTPAGELRPLDFEGACPIDQPDPMFWGTPGFTPPQRRKFSSHVGAHEDLYALGSMLYLLLTGRIPETTDPIPIAKLRRNVPQAIQEIVLRLLGHDPKRRPTTETVYQELKSALVSLSTSS